MSSSNHLQQEPLLLRHTNVSNPSFVVAPKASQQSLTASEDFYSLSSGSSHSTVGPTFPVHPIRRFSTPPSRYRTPLQSREALVQHALEEDLDKTPVQGQARIQVTSSEEGGAMTNQRPSSTDIPQALYSKGVRRAPAPTTAMDVSSPPSQQDAWPLPNDRISPSAAQSHVARDLAHDISPPTPGIDDAPFIRFALEQLTRDEEVRGSRLYPGAEGPATAERQLAPPQSRYSIQPSQQSNDAPNASLQWPSQRASREADVPPPRHANRPVTPKESNAKRAASFRGEKPTAEPDVFVQVTPSGVRYPTLDFVPGILRLPALSLFLLCVLLYVACLLLCAIWSLAHTGIWTYSVFGDGRYFVFQYLPNILGTLLFYWLVQIEVATYRIAPYIALSSPSINNRHRGLSLPLAPKGFVLPYLGHARAGQPIITAFLFVAWLQIFTLPLLASSFNVHFYNQGQLHEWRWIATQPVIWTVIALYAILFCSGLALMVWLRRVYTGVRWDPRSLADVIVLLERSNALGGSRTDEDVAQLGYWRTSARPNEIFQTYGIADKSPRQYVVEDGRIREKSSMTYPKMSMEVDVERGESRHSREKMLRDSPHHNQVVGNDRPTNSLPWFLRPSLALLWPIISVVLLIAFLVISYLPSTRVSDGFKPDVPAPVGSDGFSATNFLYSFIPSLLAMLCLLVWLDIDYAYRRLQPFASMNARGGELAERSLLSSYTADLPCAVTLSAFANRHFRIAGLSFVSTFVAPALPMLAGGVFWAQFFVPSQSIRISADLPAYYALTAFVSVYAVSYLMLFPSRAHQELAVPASHITGGNSNINTFAGLITLVHQTKLLDDVAFHGPDSKVDLVTRLLSAPPGSRVSTPPDVQPNTIAAASKTSLSDSIRGFGNARQKAVAGVGAFGVPKYLLGRYTGRDGREYVGIDRVRE